MAKYEKAPYYLVIRTDKYTGNFERECIAYCFGRLDDVQEGGFNTYSRAFWNSVAGTDCDSFSDMEKFEETYELKNQIDMSLDLLKSLEEDNPDNEDLKDTIASIEERKRKIAEENYKTDIRRLYDTYLCSTYQEVDDWEQETFYNIGRYKKNSKHCDSIYVQLKEPLSEYFENIVIPRIRTFFNDDVIEIFEKYNHVCHWNQKRPESYSPYEHIKLISLELFDKDNNLIKTYDIKDKES